MKLILRYSTRLVCPAWALTWWCESTTRLIARSVSQALLYLNTGNRYIVEIDLEKFFDRVHHDKLMYHLSLSISDKRILKLIRKYLQSGVMENGVVSPTKEGTLKGCNLSPILSNIVLDRLDKELENRGHKFVRYADDISIYVQSRRAGERVLESITKWLEKELKLKVNRSKSGVRRVDESNLLGFGFYHSSKGVGLRISQRSYDRLKEKLKKLTGRSWSISMEERMQRINDVTRGWINYFALAYRLKQCKRAIGGMRFLRNLGVPEKRCWTTAGSRKGWWKKSLTPASQEGMNNKWFKEQGLFSLLENYISFSS